MALPDSLKQVTGTQIVLADTTDYTGATNSTPSRTDQIDLTSLADGSYRQSTKFNLTANRAPIYKVNAAFEWSSAPTAGQTVDVYVSFSSSATAGNDNVGNLGGSDAAYNGYGAAATDADEVISQLDFVGSLVCGNDADIQIAEIGTFIARDQYAQIVVKNDSGSAFIADAVEMCVVITPIEHQVQD